ncbi:cell division protein FtsH [Helicobacter pylori]|nr:cell division protein FtsH [Helicobacter pylori]
MTRSRFGNFKLTEPNPTTNALKKQEPYKMVFIPLVRKTLSFRSQDVGA